MGTRIIADILYGDYYSSRRQRTLRWEGWNGVTEFVGLFVPKICVPPALGRRRHIQFLSGLVEPEKPHLMLKTLKVFRPTAFLVLDKHRLMRWRGTFTFSSRAVSGSAGQ